MSEDDLIDSGPCYFCGAPLTHVNDGGQGFIAERGSKPGQVFFCWSRMCTGIPETAADRVLEHCDIFHIAGPCVECGATLPVATTEEATR